MKSVVPEKYPRITIVTPSLNQGRFLPETIESVLGQDYTNLEYFVIDGGSTDDSVDVINKYQAHLNYWVSEKDNGQSDAIMKGFRKATGELFAWVNSDDVLLPGCLKKIVECYKDNARPDIITGNAVYIDEDGRISRFVRIPRQTRYFFFRGVWHATAPAIFFRTSLFRDIGGLNPKFRLCMDFDLWVRMMKGHACVAHVPQYLGGYRWHERAKSVQFLKKSDSKWSDEEAEIRRTCNPRLTHRKNRFWKAIYKTYQVFNLNYLRAYVSCISVKGRRWTEVFPKTM